MKLYLHNGIDDPGVTAILHQTTNANSTDTNDKVSKTKQANLADINNIHSSKPVHHTNLEYESAVDRVFARNAPILTTKATIIEAVSSNI